MFIELKVYYNPKLTFHIHTHLYSQSFRYLYDRKTVDIILHIIIITEAIYLTLWHQL